MINDGIDSLIDSIQRSDDYKKYMEISNILKDNKEVNDLLEEIRELQKESVNLEYNGDIHYKDIDKVIEEKVRILEGIPVYQEYLKRMNEVNDTISSVSRGIEDYINEVV